MKYGELPTIARLWWPNLQCGDLNFRSLLEGPFLNNLRRHVSVGMIQTGRAERQSARPISDLSIPAGAVWKRHKKFSSKNLSDRTNPLV